MKALISISGFGGDMDIIPTVPRKFQFGDSDSNHIGVSISALENLGFDCFVYIDNKAQKIKIPYFAGGNKVCIQVRKKHIFQKVRIVSNVPIYSYCEIGLFKSLVFIIKQSLAKLKK